MEAHIIHLFVKVLLCRLHILNNTTVMELWGGVGADAKGSTLFCLFSCKITIQQSFCRRSKSLKLQCWKIISDAMSRERVAVLSRKQHLSLARSHPQEPCSFL